LESLRCASITSIWSWFPVEFRYGINDKVFFLQLVAIESIYRKFSSRDAFERMACAVLQGKRSVISVLIEAAVRRCMHGRRDMNDDFSKAASVFRIEDAAATNISGYSYDSVKVDTDTVMTDTNGAKIPQWLLRAYLRDLG